MYLILSLTFYFKIYYSKFYPTHYDAPLQTNDSEYFSLHKAVVLHLTVWIMSTEDNKEKNAVEEL